MSALGAALRISRRDARRFKGRTALIMVMIGLPVLVFSALLTTLAMVDVTPREDLPALLGAADARIVTQEGRPVQQDLANVMGVGRDKTPGWTQAKIAALVHGRLVPCDLGSVWYRVGGAWGLGSALEVDLRDPMTSGMRTMVEGRPPASPGEVAVSEGVRAQGVRLGDTIGVTRAERPVRVVGVYEYPTRPQYVELLGNRGVLLFDKSDGHGTGWLYAGGPVGWSQVRAMNQAGLLVQSRAVIEDPPAAATRPGKIYGAVTDVSWIALGTLAIVMETVLLAGPAFAVGLRRRRRELAMISAQGGSAGHLRTVVLADGLVLGGAAAVAATLLGIALPVLVFPLARLWFVPVGPADVPWAAVLGVAALGLASGLVAALVPALQAGRQSPARVLAGRAAEARERVGRPRLGLLCVVAGLAVVGVGQLGRTRVAAGVSRMLLTVGERDVTRLSAVAGGMLVVLGLVGVLPWLVRRSARLASRLPLPLRLAVRDAARHRSRTATAAAAVMAATTAAVAFGLVLNGSQAVQELLVQHLVPMNSLQIVGSDLDDRAWANVVAAAGQRLPGVRLAPGNDLVNSRGQDMVLQAPCQKLCETYGNYTGMLPVGDARLLAFLQGHQDARAAAALAAGQVVVFDPALIRNGSVILQLYPRGSGLGKMTTLRLPAVRATPDDPELRGALVPPGALTSHGLKPVERRLYGMDVPEHLEQLQANLSAVGDAYVDVESDGQGRLARSLWMALFAAMVLVLGGTFAATGLAAADLRGDLDTMTAVGAPPRVRKLVVAGQAGYIAGLGALVGALVGGVVGAVLTAGSISSSVVDDEGGGAVSLALSVPWLFVAGLVVGLPLLAAVVAGGFTRTRWAPARRVG